MNSVCSRLKELSKSVKSQNALTCWQLKWRGSTSLPSSCQSKVLKRRKNARQRENAAIGVSFSPPRAPFTTTTSSADKRSGKSLILGMTVM